MGNPKRNTYSRRSAVRSISVRVGWACLLAHPVRVRCSWWSVCRREFLVSGLAFSKAVRWAASWRAVLLECRKCSAWVASCGVGVISTCWAWVQTAMVTSRVSSPEGACALGRSRSMELTALAVVNGVNAVVMACLLLLL